MALISCPDCGHQVSTGARACPGCGWLNPDGPPEKVAASPELHVERSEGAFLQSLNAGCAIVLFVAGGAIALVAVTIFFGSLAGWLDS